MMLFVVDNVGMYKTLFQRSDMKVSIYAPPKGNEEPTEGTL